MPEGHTIHRLALDHARLVRGRRLRVTSPQGRFTDASRVDGAELLGIEAYGKHLFHEWSTGEVGHIHLGLFGRFTVHHTAAPPDARGAVRMRMSTMPAPDDDRPHVTIDLAGPTACSIGPPEDRDRIVARLGPDPLRADADPAVAITAMRRSSRAIGALLLDQSVLAGVGNVYRAEILFVCGIHPLRPGTSCSDDQLDAVWRTAASMLRAGVKANRIVTVRRAELGLPRGAPITRRDATYVYKRDRCLRCGTPITTMPIANRTSYHCPVCQPA